MQTLLSPSSLQELSNSLHTDASYVEKLPLEKMPAGSKVYRFTIGQASYALKKFNSDQTIEVFTTQLTCLNLAAKANIAPKVVYSSLADRCIVMKEIEGRRLFDKSITLNSKLIVQLANVVRSLHSIDDFAENIAEEVENRIDARLAQLPGWIG